MAEGSVVTQYHKELAREKARIGGKTKRTAPDALEIAAQRRQAERDRANKQPTGPEQQSPCTPDSDAQADWVQFNPLQAETQDAQGPRRVSTITIFCLAKKMMAEEWRRAKGIRKRDPRVAELERSAGQYQARKIAKQEEKRRQAMCLKQEHDRLLECVDDFVHAMLDRKHRNGVSSLDEVGDLMVAAFGTLGEVVRVEWTEGGGCTIWLEPWPDRSKRRRRGDVQPVLGKLTLDAKLNISAYERVTDPVVRQEKRAGLLLQRLRQSTNEIRRLRTGQEVLDFVAQEAWELGRVLDTTLENGWWKIRIQPWDEVRRHNVNTSNNGPIPEYEITVSKDLQTLSCKRLED